MGLKQSVRDGVSRRRFLQSSAVAAGTAWWVSGQAHGFQNSISAMEQLNFACIGVGGKGASDTVDASGVGKIVALCDIDERTLKKRAAGDGFTEAKQYVDFRVMLDELGDQIDVVTVSTPDHTHAVAAAAALRLGKHVFCQKPLTWSVEESRVLRQLAQERKADGVCTQMGIQGVASARLREGVEFLRSGQLGDVTEVHIWTNRPIWPQGEGRPKTSAEPPQAVHWDLFLGPAPERPYNPTAYHPFKWRGWIDFGTGAIGDIACHTGALPVMALNLYDPESVVAESSGVVENETYPKNAKITFQFPQRPGHDGKMLAACKMVWYDGGHKPDPSLFWGEPVVEGGGFLAIGQEGRFYAPQANGMEWSLLPKEKKFQQPAASLPRLTQPENGVDAHFSEFARACRASSPDAALANFEFAGRLTETFLLGNVALRADGEIRWNGETITNDPSAVQYLGRKYREGWTL